MQLPESWGIMMPDVDTLSALWAKANRVYAAQETCRKLRLAARRRQIAEQIPESPCDSRFSSFTSSGVPSPGAHSCNSPASKCADLSSTSSYR